LRITWGSPSRWRGFCAARAWRYTLAMFDQHLRHIPQPLLDSASSCYPEVAIVAK
jgi:hypothetical protein